MRALLAIFFLILTSALNAGTINGARTGNPVSITGSVTDGNCVKFDGSGAVADSGAPCADIDIGALDPSVASAMAYLLGVDAIDVDKKVAVNTTDGLPIFTGNNLLPYTSTQNIGSTTATWRRLYLPHLASGSSIIFTDNVTSMSLNAPTGGLTFTFSPTGSTGRGTLDFSALTADRTINLLNTSGAMTLLITSASLTNQSADISSTNFTGANVAGLYRVSYQLMDTTADVTAGTVTVAIAWTDAGGATSMAQSTNENSLISLGTVGSGGHASGAVFAQLESGSISYSTSHTGIFGTAKYALYMTVERVL